MLAVLLPWQVQYLAGQVVDPAGEGGGWLLLVPVDGRQVGPGWFEGRHWAREHLVLGRRFVNPRRVSGHWLGWVVARTK